MAKQGVAGSPALRPFPLEKLGHLEKILYFPVRDVTVVSLINIRPRLKSETYAPSSRRSQGELPLGFRAEEGETPPACSAFSAFSSFSSLLAPVRCGRSVGAVVASINPIQGGNSG